MQYLRYQPPYDWETILATFRAHQLPHLEFVDHQAYERITETSKGLGFLRVEHDPQKHAVRLLHWNGAEQDVEQDVRNIRRMFDLDADVGEINRAMDADPSLSTIWKRYPGIRIARSWNGFESMVATILGQVVSVRFARVLIEELMGVAGVKTTHPKTGGAIHLFPTAEQLLIADLGAVRTSEARRTALRSLAGRVVAGDLFWKGFVDVKDLRRILLSLPGVGVWTSEYVAMRGFHDDDAFPGTDYVLKQELKRHLNIDVSRVRPWRAYAANVLWKSFAATKGISCETVV